MTQPDKHRGSCHCGKVRYEVTIDLSKPVLSCNCSICQRKGTLLGFVPADAFRLISGKDDVTDYQFGTKNIHHLFCSTCGVTSFATGTGPDGSRMVAINVRCLEDVTDVKALNVQEFDGRSQ